MDNFQQYEPTLNYPKKRNFGTTYYYSRGKVVASIGPDGKTRYADSDRYADSENDLVSISVLSKCVTETVIDEEAYQAALNAYNEQQNALAMKFKLDLFAELGITRNPKREKLYSIAYDKGHAHGYADIYAQACSLVELIED